jgi:hypothetical protein
MQIIRRGRSKRSVAFGRKCGPGAGGSGVCWPPGRRSRTHSSGRRNRRNHISGSGRSGTYRAAGYRILRFHCRHWRWLRERLRLAWLGVRNPFHLWSFGQRNGSRRRLDDWWRRWFRLRSCRDQFYLCVGLGSLLSGLPAAHEQIPGRYQPEVDGDRDHASYD